MAQDSIWPRPLEREVEDRRAFFQITDEDLARIAALRPHAEKRTETIVDAFYELLLAFGPTRQLFRDGDSLRRAKRLQREYFLGLFTGKLDRAYVEHRLHVGAAHARIGVEPTWYLGAYRRYMHLLLEAFSEDIGDPAEVVRAFTSVQKLVYFDVSLALDAYFSTTFDVLRRHEASIRAMSTPIIRVHDGVLLLPLIGAIDDQRAQQIIEAVLQRVSEEQARVLLLDIAGISTVDAQIAQHLVKTTAAVRLLGASVVLTGVRPGLAKTLVEIDADMSGMHTVGELAAGIELALDIVGKAIMPRAERQRTAEPPACAAERRPRPASGGAR
ncbi:protoglobin domain-containing protein [Sorangium sp. So ce726]|uniref:protoglobin domain-containing protein n=1 Tax=Sorangium sp. So ce726 TaxID=3133319 RepID=UPI003F5F8E40